MTVLIPDSHRDLFCTPVHGVLTTMMPDGTPQASIVWVDYDGECVLINTTLERQKGRNMQANPKVAILVIDPKDSGRWIEVRGQVQEMTTDGAVPHADRLTQRYTGKQSLLSRYLSAGAASQRDACDREDKADQDFARCDFSMKRGV